MKSESNKSTTKSKPEDKKIEPATAAVVKESEKKTEVKEEVPSSTTSSSTTTKASTTVEVKEEQKVTDPTTIRTGKYIILEYKMYRFESQKPKLLFRLLLLQQKAPLRLKQKRRKKSRNKRPLKQVSYYVSAEKEHQTAIQKLKLHPLQLLPQPQQPNLRPRFPSILNRRI